MYNIILSSDVNNEGSSYCDMISGNWVELEVFWRE